MIPVSGGKDSTWQVLQCLELGLKPLAVTWRPPGRTAIGQRNLDNLVSLGVDHIDWSINPATEARFMLKAFERTGSTAVPMHLALFAIPLRVAVRFRIPLVVWGENSAFEYGAADDAHTGFQLDGAWLRTYGVTQGTVAADWVGDGLTARDLASYACPTDAEMDAAGVRAVFLGWYLPWDPAETARVAAVHGFRADANGPRTGLWNFADIDDDFIALHHWMKWYKFGFTRMFDNLSIDIRNGRITRADALRTLAAAGEQRPDAEIRKFCEFAGIGVDRFMAIAETFRNPSIWHRDANGHWRIRDFLVSDWRWDDAA